MRIIDDDRYLGNETYPQLIDEATLERMRSRKSSRNTQSSTDRQSGIYRLKVPVICPSCGEAMHRRQDARCECIQKWGCGQCGTQIEKADAVLMEEITKLLNTLICNPEMIHSYRHCQKELPIEQRRLDNEIARTLEGYDFDKDALREMWKPLTKKKPRLSWTKKQSCRSSLTALQTQSKNVKTQNPDSTKSS